MTDLMENFVSFEQVTYRDGVYHPWIKIFFNIDNVSSIQQRPELPTNCSYPQWSVAELTLVSGEKYYIKYPCWEAKAQ